MNERILERILQEEQDEAVVEAATREFLGVPGGRYWEPGSEENPPLPEDQQMSEDEELPFN